MKGGMAAAPIKKCVGKAEFTLRQKIEKMQIMNLCVCGCICVFCKAGAFSKQYLFVGLFKLKSM